MRVEEVGGRALPDTGASVSGRAGAGGSDAVGTRADNPAVSAALSELAGLDDLPVDQHIAVYERAHRRLTDAMANTDDA